MEFWWDVLAPYKALIILALNFIFAFVVPQCDVWVSKQGVVYWNSFFCYPLNEFFTDM